MAKHLRLPVFVAAGYSLLILACLFSNPPGAPPDEAAHYIKAAAVRDGDIVLDKRPPLARRLAPPTDSERWMLEQARLVSLPRLLSPEVFRCWGIPGRLQPCGEEPPPGKSRVEELTYVGSYPPVPYLLPGVAMALAPDAIGAVYLGRAASAIAGVAFLGLSLVVLWDPRAGWVSLAGPVAVISPMVVFLVASISGSGLEIAAALCFFACLMRLARTAGNRDGGQTGAHPGAVAVAPGWVWWTTGISGSILATARDLGLVWLLMQVGIFLAFIGVKRAVDTLRNAGKAFYVTGFALALSGAAGLVWQARVQVRPPFDLAAWISNIRSPSLSFNAIVKQQIGIFGPLDTVMPRPAYLLWILLVLSLVLSGFLAADRRARIVLGAAAAATAATTIALDAAQRLVGFGVQGRYLLPLALCVPVLAGEILAHTDKSLKRYLRWPAMAWACLACGVHVLAWYTIARRYSVGVNGPVFFSLDSAWRPPGDWLTWGVVSAGGAALIGGAALFSVLRDPNASF